MPWTMVDRKGQRKYLTRSESEQFLIVARQHDPETYALCWILAVSGCRISEALSLSVRNVDFETNSLVIRSLKKREKLVYRNVPMPVELISALRRWIDKRVLDPECFWPMSRMTAYRRVRDIMIDAGIFGGQASPKGLRHAFGVNAVQSGVPLNMVQRWLGHADMKTTAIYASAMGPEEREIASRMWRGGRRTADGEACFACRVLERFTHEHFPACSAREGATKISACRCARCPRESGHYDGFRPTRDRTYSQP